VTAISVAAGVYRSTSHFVERFYTGRKNWQKISPAWQLIGCAVIAVGCATLFGAWVSERIKQDVLHQSAESSALFVSSVVQPLVQDLATGNELDSQARAALDAWHNETALGKHIVTTKIWRTDGTVIYSNKFEHIGETYPGGPQLVPALDGAVAAKLINPQDTRQEPGAGFALLGFFTPIREEGSDRIIAVAEIYRLATKLESDLSTIRRHSWLVVSTLTLAFLCLLFFIARRGSRTIGAQHLVLNRQTGKIARLRAFNKKLLLRFTEFRSIAADANEEFLRRVGSDLHDGPAQHVAFALLRIDALSSTLAAAKIKSTELEKLRRVLQESHQEIRNAARGLFFPRELEDATITETVRLAVRNHERRTGTRVRCAFGKMPDRVSRQLQVCAYRFVQEGLSNAFRHAAGRNQEVRASCDGIRINIEIADKGPGCSQESMQTGGGLGLVSLRSRVESLGGIFLIESRPGSGTRLRSILFIPNPGVRRAQPNPYRNHR
jgi:signal transduction histidine kinase